jgi:MFS family permease
MRRRPEDIGLFPDGDTPLQNPDEIYRPENLIAGLPSRRNWTVREALKTKSLWILLAAFNLIALCLNGINIHFYPYMADKGIGTDVAAGAMTLYAVCCAVVKIPWGLVAEKFSVRYCVIIVFCGSAIGLFILLMAKSHAAVFFFAVVYGLALGGMMVLREVIFADYFGHECLGAIRGVVMPINVVFMALSPILASWLYETFDNYAVPYGVFLFNFLLGAIFMLFAKPPENDQP